MKLENYYNKLPWKTLQVNFVELSIIIIMSVLVTILD